MPGRTLQPAVVVSCAHVGQRGAVSPCGKIVESEYSRRVAYELGHVLGVLGVSYSIVEKRLEDKAREIDVMTMPWRLDKVPCCAVEVHLNALRRPDLKDEDGDGNTAELVPDLRGHGFLALYDTTDRQEEALAMAVCSELAVALPWAKNRGAQPCPGPWVARERLTFLQDTATTAVLVEALFLTHPTEIDFLLKPTAPRILAGGIGRGVAKWLEAQEG